MKEKVLRVNIQKKLDRAEDEDDNGDPMMLILISLVKKVFRIKTSKQCINGDYATCSWKGMGFALLRGDMKVRGLENN